MSGKVNKFSSKLEKINRLSEELVICLINDSNCLDKKPYSQIKKQVYQQAIAYFESKKIYSQTRTPKTTNNTTAILLQLAIQEWRSSVDEKEHQAAAKIVKLVLETSVTDLMLVPEDVKTIAFKIIRMYLTEIGGLHS